MEIIEAQKEQLRAIGERFDLKLVLLYGSCAKGTQTKLSDFDIAVMGKKPLDFNDHIELYREFSGVFGDIKRDLDVQILDRKDPLFLYQVAKSSKLLYGSTPAYNEFRA